MRLRSIVGVLCILGALVGPASAQTPVLNPTEIDFPASPDHDATYPISGQLKLTGYEVRIFPNAAPTTGTPVQTIPVGKPVPVNGRIVVSGVLANVPQNELLKAVIVAVGPGGTSTSSPASGPFARETLIPPAGVGEAPVLRSGSGSRRSLTVAPRSK